ncbi:hypothetical protein [uncultured Microscilla sp.]|uniref:hypothetical protein n=1 Tax=uncultured Microscilla sp. TaxID=432653 RepID=UPI00261347E9|nr:hypothetical protein [uncultured Microscilla sp.]
MNLLISIKDCIIQGHRIPDFDIFEGQMVSIYSPVNYLEDRLQSQLDGFNIFHKPLYVDGKLKSDGNIWYCFKKITLYQYIAKYSKLSSNEIKLILNVLEIPLDTLAKNIRGAFARLIINIEIGFNNSNFLLINTAGLDPKGIIDLYNYLYEKIKINNELSIIIIQSPTSIFPISHFKLQIINEDNLLSVADIR